MRAILLIISLCLVHWAHGQRAIDVIHYRFQIGLSDTSNRIFGKADIEFRARQTTTQIEIDLGKYDKNGKGMQVNQVGRYGDRQSNPSVS